MNNASDANRYEFAPLTQLTPEQDNISMLLNVKHAFSDDFRGFTEVLFNRNLTDIVYTPISISSTAIPVSINPNDGTLVIPANNPYNPFGQALSNFRGRGNFGPTRTFDVDSTGLTSLFGTEGDLAGDWKWNTHFVYGFSLVDQVAGGQIENDSLQEALNGTLPGFQGSFLNPFGPSANAAMVSSLFVNSNSSSETKTIGGGGRRQRAPGDDAGPFRPALRGPGLAGGGRRVAPGQARERFRPQSLSRRHGRQPLRRPAHGGIPPMPSCRFPSCPSISSWRWPAGMTTTTPSAAR